MRPILAIVISAALVIGCAVVSYHIPPWLLLWLCSVALLLNLKRGNKWN